MILTSADGDLAKRELKTREELEDGVEILHGDWKTSDRRIHRAE